MNPRQQNSRPPESSQPAADTAEDAPEKSPVAQAIERADKLAESELDMARMFLARDKPDIARRRLETIVTEYGRSAVAQEARRMLRNL